MNWYDLYRIYQLLVKEGIMKWIVDHWIDILAIWGGVCVCVDTITGLTKTTKDDKAWSRIKAVLGSIFSLKTGK
jgi:hypothetical protein